MKKLKILLSAVIAITTVFSLGAQSSYIVTAEAASRADCFLDQDGKNATITLRGNPSTGYEWKCNVENPGITNMIYQDYIPGESMGNAFEPDGTYVWKFAGFWQGETEVTFTCEKEGVAEPAETITYVVTVDSDLNINFTEKKQDSQTGIKTVEFEGDADLIKHWRPEADDTGIVDVINKGYKDFYDNDYKYEHNQKILSWDIKGLKEGKTKVKFIYDDSSDVKAYRTKTFLAKVDSDLNVTLSEEEYKVEADSNVVILEGNASTGSQWKYNIKDPEITKVSGEKYISHDDTGMRCGCAETDAWAFEGLKEGETEAVFTYLHPGDTEPSETVTYKINVDSDLNVTISKK